ncbi:endopygalactorunase [Terrimonas alba]|uniref:endopygalactorunase n=1 Tax=Terrimonas alba TaxID=3349636 RepID=UPI0035F397D3
MMKMHLFIITFVVLIISASAQQNKISRAGVEIVPNRSTHISRITPDSIIVLTGSTYSFTVDTPEDEGLVSLKTSIQDLLSQVRSKVGTKQQYHVIDQNGRIKNSGDVDTGDRLVVTIPTSKKRKTYYLNTRPGAIGGQLRIEQDSITVNGTTNITLHFTAGQRSPDATVSINIPPGILVNMDNTTVNVIGRGEVKLKDLARQSIGRTGTNYSYTVVGEVLLRKSADGGTSLVFNHLDLRPVNGADLTIVIRDINISGIGHYLFQANYTTSKPAVLTSPGVGAETALLTVTKNISDLERLTDKSLHYKETTDTYTKLYLKWSNVSTPGVQVMQSIDNGKTWTRANAVIDTQKAMAAISNLTPDQLYTFRIFVKEGSCKGYSNIVQFYSGKIDIKKFGVKGNGDDDDTEKINQAINRLHEMGGGTLLFSDGIYNVRTIHLKSNVYLFINKGATIKAIKGADTPESTWFSDKKYRSGLSPTDVGPYADPENYLTKQDVGHHYFRNTMFFGERLDNVKIIGNGYITGNGNLVTSDKVMNNAPDNRADKMFTLKLCTNLEIGGIYRENDLWYDSTRDEPYYIRKDGSRDFDTDNMLKIDRGGHFVLLATGTDHINVHDTYFGRDNSSNARDIYDFMGCNDVTVTNIYSKVSSDDIVKPGSDCSLGFTRPAKNYKVRNIIGDTNCNLFQIGSETADDIMDIHVDNIYVLGANKAGFSISTNDGAHIKDIHLNCGHTGILHSRSRMLRTFTPFFISISNRGRILGAGVSRFKFDENGTKHDELLVTNVNIGVVENIILNGIDISEVYGGSSYGVNKPRWKAYDGSQRRATPIVAGYSLPDTKNIEGGLTFQLPNGKHTGYIKNIVFNDMNLLVKGGNPLSDTAASPPELGVGQYNASNLKVQPSYGLWARHVMGLTVMNCSFNFEKPDNRYALFLDDVIGATITGIKMVKSTEINNAIKLKNSSAVSIENAVYYQNEQRKSPTLSTQK